MIKVPILCPICKNSMQYIDLHRVERKSCLFRIDHKISFSWQDHPSVIPGEEAVQSIILSDRKDFTFKWDFEIKKIFVYSGCYDMYHTKYHMPTQYKILPFIEPDFLNWKKSFNKLKKYVIFI